MDNACPEILPDLIVNACPLGCNQECAIIWTNKTIGNRIICDCKCGHNKKGKVLADVGESVSNTIGMTEPSEEENLR
jgi:hypothetical protein